VGPAFGYTRADQEPSIRVLLAGPGVNLITGPAVLLVAHEMIGTLPYLGVLVLRWVGEMSILVGVFNLLPIWPLDGYRVCEAVAGRMRSGIPVLRGVLAAIGPLLAGVLVTHAVLAADLIATVSASLLTLLSVVPMAERLLERSTGP